MDSDLGGGLFFRLLRDDPQVGDLERIDKWKVSARGEQLYLDSIQKIDKEIEGLKRFHIMAEEPQPRTMYVELLKRISKKQEWNESILKGVVFKKMKEIEGLAKQGEEWRLLVDEKNEEIALLQREAEHCGKQLAEKSAVTKDLEIACSALRERLKEKEDEITALQRAASLHTEQVVEKSKMTEALRIAVGNITDRLRETEDDRSQKLAEKDSEITRILAEKDLLMEAHRIECSALRSQAEGIEAKFERFLTAMRTFGQHCSTFRTEMEEIDSNDNQPEKELSVTCLKSFRVTLPSLQQAASVRSSFFFPCLNFPHTGMAEGMLRQLLGEVEAEYEQTKRKRTIENESAHGSAKRQQIILNRERELGSSKI